MNQQPKGPYVYQPYGAVTDPERAACGRLWGVGGLSMLANITGLRRAEAEAILSVLKELPPDTEADLAALRSMLGIKP